MPKMATKAADNVFYKARIAAASWNDRLGSREGASEVTGIDRTRLANIELGTINPHPEEVLMLSDTYNAPELQNHFCSHLCPLGIGTISPIELEELERVTLQLISAMKSLPEVKDGIIDIAADGVIDAKEKPRMEQYLEVLDEITNKAQTLKLIYRKGINDVANLIADSGIRSPGYRARRVALTEVLRAHGYAQLESYIQSPAVEEKMWKHTGAYRNDPRQNHVDMDGVHVPKGQPFTLIGADGNTYYPMTPRDVCLPPRESVNCHCLLQPVVSEEVLGLSLEERQALQAQAIAEDDGEWEKELDAQNKARAGINEEDYT